MIYIPRNTVWNLNYEEKEILVKEVKKNER